MYELIYARIPPPRVSIKSEYFIIILDFNCRVWYIFCSHVSVTIITEGLLTETIPDSSSILLLIWQTFERKKVGQTEDGFAGDSTVLTFILLYGILL